MGPRNRRRARTDECRSQTAGPGRGARDRTRLCGDCQSGCAERRIGEEAESTPPSPIRLGNQGAVTNG